MLFVLFLCNIFALLSQLYLSSLGGFCTISGSMQDCNILFILTGRVFCLFTRPLISHAPLSLLRSLHCIDLQYEQLQGRVHVTSTKPALCASKTNRVNDKVTTLCQV